jgi:hypothetical protein
MGAPGPIPFGQIAGILFVYGVTLFTVLSDILTKQKLAAYLTRQRGKNWPKEIDYIYLSIGAVGILMSLNRIDIVTERFQGTDIIGPILLTTAVVLRLIKTRAEIGGWNKL